MSDPELDALAGRYARRPVDDRYSPLRPEVCRMLQERQRALLDLLGAARLADVSRLRLVEVGCGEGGNLLELLQLGFAPEGLIGIELLPQRLLRARHRLPEALRLLGGDASTTPIEPGSQDLVLQSTVFSSLLDEAFQHKLADAMWRWVRPGGAVIWYDFTIDNPRNPDVRGVPARRVQALFPHGQIHARRVTLAPPLARVACRVHPGLYGALNLLPWLRTHLLAWVAKPR